MERQPGGGFFDDFEKLLGEARTGSQEAKQKAKERLLLPFQQELRRWATRTAGHEFRPESDSDIAQGIFVRAWQSFDEFRGNTEKQFISWLRAIFHNELNRIFRYHHQEKRDVSRTVPLDMAIAERMFAQESESAVDHLILEEQVKAVRKALEDLPKEHMPFLVLHYSIGMSYKEIGASLRLSPEAARKKCERARTEILHRLAAD